MLAVTNGNSELAQLLVDHDAQVDCTDKHLRTALHRAVSLNKALHASHWKNIKGVILWIEHYKTSETIPNSYKGILRVALYHSTTLWRLSWCTNMTISIIQVANGFEECAEVLLQA